MLKFIAERIEKLPDGAAFDLLKEIYTKKPMSPLTKFGLIALGGIVGFGGGYKYAKVENGKELTKGADSANASYSKKADGKLEIQWKKISGDSKKFDVIVQDHSRLFEYAKNDLESIKSGEKSKMQSLVQFHIAPQLPVKLRGYKIIIWDNPKHNYGYRVISTALLKELREIQKEAIETFGIALTADVSGTHRLCNNWAKYALDQNRFSAIATKVLKKHNIEPDKPFYQANYDEFKSEKFNSALFPNVNNEIPRDLVDNLSVSESA